MENSLESKTQVVILVLLESVLEIVISSKNTKIILFPVRLRFGVVEMILMVNGSSVVFE